MAKKLGRSDLITGAFALLVVVCFIGVLIHLQAIGPKVEGDRYVIMFDDVGGVTSNTPVYIAGQRVGKVDSIRTLPRLEDGVRRVEVEVGIIIDEAFASVIAVPVDTVARVQMGGLFGGNQIVLNLGREQQIVQPGGRLPNTGLPPVTFDTLLIGVEGTIKELDAGLKNVSRVLNDQTFIGNIEGSMDALRATLDQMNKSLQELDPALSRVAPTMENAEVLMRELRALIEDNSRAINATMVNLERATGRLDGLLADGDDGVPQLVAGLNHIANNLDSLVGNMNDLVLDNQLNIQISLENVRETTESLRVFARRIERDPSLLVWGGSEREGSSSRVEPRVTPNVDELSIRNSGRRPRRESD